MSDDKKVKVSKKAENEKPNFTVMKNEELMDELFNKNITAPIDEHGKLIRKHAIHLLNKWMNDNLSLFKKDRLVRVIFHKPNSTTSDKYLFVGLNGKGWQIPYEKEFVVPESVVRVADDAVSSRYTYSHDQHTGSKELVEETVRTVPYTMLGYVDLEDSAK